MHMVAARLGYNRAMVGTGWANSHLVVWQGRLLGLLTGVCQPRVLTIACSLMSGQG